MHDDNKVIDISSSQLYDTFSRPVGNMKSLSHVAVHDELSEQDTIAFSTTLLIFSTEQQQAKPVKKIQVFIKNAIELTI